MLRDVVRFLMYFFFYFRYITSCILVLWPFWHTLYLYLIFIYIDVCSFTYLSMCCFFSIFIHMFLSMYAIYYFYFILKCLDEFCLKCFRNTDCQSLLAMNSFLAKFFKNLCYNRFYCIQQVNMSWVIYDFSHICLFVSCCFGHGLPTGGIVKTYVFHMLGIYVTILCNWLILWQNALYL